MTGFRPSPALAIANRFVTVLLRAGLPVGTRRTPMALLTVKGRKTGRERSTPVALLRRAEGWLLVAVYGECDWSRNLEAAGRATLGRRRRVVSVKSRRLDPIEAGEILRDAIGGAPAMVRSMTAPYFAADSDSSAEAWRREAANHPVFLLTPI